MAGRKVVGSAMCLKKYWKKLTKNWPQVTQTIDQKSPVSPPFLRQTPLVAKRTS